MPLSSWSQGEETLKTPILDMITYFIINTITLLLVVIFVPFMTFIGFLIYLKKDERFRSIFLSKWVLSGMQWPR